MKKLLCLLVLGFVAAGCSAASAQARYSELFAQARGFSGYAHCPITGATGTARAVTAAKALSAAIAQCIGKGGVPACCRKHSSASPL